MSEEQRKIRYAVVGLGNIAQVAVLPAFAHAKANSELVALVSSDREKLDALTMKYGVTHSGSYEDLERILFESRADAVYIATPNTLHRPFAERAAATGAHVLCEKPMAMTVEDCEAMIAATKACGVKLMIAYRLHFDVANMKVIERVAQGEIGEPRLFTSTFSQQVREGDIRTQGKLGGGASYDMGVYCINAARYLFRAEPLHVMATQLRGGDPRFEETDDTTSAVLDFGHGRVALFTASQAASDVDEYRIVGTKGDIRLEPAYAYSKGLAEFVTVDESTDASSSSKHDQFAPELLHFSACILEHAEPEPSGEEGLCDVRVLRAIEMSARTGRRIQLAPFDRRVRPSPDLAMKKPAVGKVKTVNAPSPSR